MEDTCPFSRVLQKFSLFAVSALTHNIARWWWEPFLIYTLLPLFYPALALLGEHQECRISTEIPRQVNVGPHCSIASACSSFREVFASVVFV